MRAWTSVAHQVLAPRAGPATAPVGLRDVVEGDRVRWDVLGSTSAGCWCARGERVVVLTSGDSAKLPNAITVQNPGARSLAVGDVWVGHGFIEMESAMWRVTRWWDPKPSPAPIAPGRVASLVQLGAWEREGRIERFVDALCAGDADHGLEAALSMLGRGRGLTPEGDDLLLGAISAVAFTQDGYVASALALCRDPILEAARVRTTLLSRSLLNHAFKGEVPGPLRSLLLALAGRGGLADALLSVRQIGESSGDAWARGVAIAMAQRSGVVT